MTLSDSRKNALFVALIVLTACVVYSNAIRVPFVFDDNGYILENPALKNSYYLLHPSELQSGNHLYNVMSSIKSRYIGHLSFFLNMRLGGFDPTGYHIVNIVIHILNSILVFFIMSEILRTQRPRPDNPLIAFFIAIIFTAHPLQTQSVTYISQRFASLSAFFCLASLYYYLIWRKSEGLKRKTAYAISTLSIFLAMFTKEISFAFPFAILLVEFAFLKRETLKPAFLIPYFASMLIVPIARLQPGKTLFAGIEEASRTTIGYSRWQYFINQFPVTLTYLRLLFLPVGQNIDHDAPDYVSILNAPVLLSMLAHLALIAIAVILWKKGQRLFSFGIFWFYICLSVESSVIPLADLIFEHRAYLPSLGPIAAFTYGMFLLFDRLNASRYAAVLLSIIVIILASAAYSRNTVWQSQISIWEDSLSKSPKKGRVHANLGYAYFWNGLYDKAVGELELASRLYRDDDEYLYYILASTYEKRMQTGKAVESYEKALKISPDFAEANNALGIIYADMKMTDKAIELYSRAIKAKPFFAEAYNNLGSALRSKGQIANAVASYRQAIKINTSYADAHFNLGLLFLENGRPDLARLEFSTALKSNPDHAMASQFIKYIDGKTQ